MHKWKRESDTLDGAQEVSLHTHNAYGINGGRKQNCSFLPGAFLFCIPFICNLSGSLFFPMRHHPAIFPFFAESKLTVLSVRTRNQHIAFGWRRWQSQSCDNMSSELIGRHVISPWKHPCMFGGSTNENCHFCYDHAGFGKLRAIFVLGCQRNR